MRCQSGGCQEIVQLPSQDFPGRELFGLTLSRRYLDWRLDCHSGFCLWEGVFRLILLHFSMFFGLGQLSEDMISIDLRGMNGFELQARFKRFRLVKVSFE